MIYKFSELFKWTSGKPIVPSYGEIPIYGSNGIIGYTDSARFEDKIILGRVGAYCGSVVYCKGLFNATDNTLVTTCDESKIINQYAYYLLKSFNLNAFAGGAAQPLITQSILKRLKCDIPPIDIQQCIASILSAYDKLIENNNKRIRILEKMAENLYTEWFVRFRFPGHENVPMENGLPKGWRYIIVGERYNVTIGKTPPRKEFEWFVSNDVNAQNWLTISDMKGMFVWDTAEQITRTALERFNMVIVPAKTILLSFKLTVGRVTIASVPLCTNEAIAHFVNVPTIEHEYLYQQLRLFDYRKLGNTSAIGNAINSKIVKSMKLVLPTTDKLETFHKMVAPIFNKILSLTKQSSNLARQRDLLLPRLMSGKLSISVD